MLQNVEALLRHGLLLKRPLTLDIELCGWRGWPISLCFVCVYCDSWVGLDLLIYGAFESNARANPDLSLRDLLQHGMLLRKPQTLDLDRWILDLLLYDAFERNAKVNLDLSLRYLLQHEVLLRQPQTLDLDWWICVG